MNPPCVLLIPIRGLGLEPGKTPYYESVRDGVFWLMRGDVEREHCVGFFEAIPGVLSAEQEQEVDAALGEALNQRLTERFPYALLPFVTENGGFVRGFHAASFQTMRNAFRARGFRVLCEWTLAEARALTKGPDPDVNVDEEFEQILEDIEEWFLDHVPPIAENLRGPACDALELAEEILGFSLPRELRALYARHDGQIEREQDLFLPGGAFLPVLTALGESDVALRTHLGCERGRATSPEEVKAAIVAWHVPFAGEAFRKEETNAHWFCFASMENFHLVVHLETGRVFQWVRQDAIYLVADSIRDYFEALANDLWKGRYLVGGDPSLEEVEVEGFLYLRRHLMHVDSV